jgi:hypothetical protein
MLSKKEIYGLKNILLKNDNKKACIITRFFRKTLLKGLIFNFYLEKKEKNLINYLNFIRNKKNERIDSKDIFRF